MPIVDDFRLTEKQREFVSASGQPGVKEVLIAGAIRSGKSQVAARIMVGWAMKHPGLYMACRATYRELEDSTKKIFLEGDGALPPAIPYELIARNGVSKANNKVKLVNGSEIMFRSLEETESGRAKIRNITLSGAFIDQLEEFDSEAAHRLYGEIVSRLSHPSGPRRLIACANPAPETHWAYDRFVNERTASKGSRYIHVTLWDNADNLTPDYVEWAKEQEEQKPDFYKRFILGEWGAFGGKRFKAWNPELHVVSSIDFQMDKDWEIVEGIDYGFHNPFAVVWCAIDYDGRWWVLAEHYESEQTISHHATAIKKIREDLNLNVSASYIDPSTFAKTRAEFESVVMELQECGIHPGKAQNERLGGWARLDEMLSERLFDGYPRLRVLDRCNNLIRELPSARCKEGMDDIEKENDHALDALRYAVMTRPQVPDRPEPPKSVREERMETVLRRSLDRGRRARLVHFG